MIKQAFGQIKNYNYWVLLLLIIVVLGAFTFVYENSESVKFTVENSGLPSKDVRAIFIDSSNVKWIGTDKGLARYDDESWVVYADSGYFKSNVINDIAFEKTDFGNELWFATDSGLTVGSVGVDGITGATTYYPGDEIGSTILDFKVNHVAVDNMHNRWVASATGISVMNGSTWDKQLSTADAEGYAFDLKDVTITDVVAYEFKELALFSTREKGIVRNGFNEVDGITGASTYGMPWAAVESNSFNAIDTKGELQWYGSDIGAYEHPEHETKSAWNLFNITNGLLDNNVISVYIDKDDNIWMGTVQGLNIYTVDNKWYRYTDKEGLINNQVNNITSDMDGNVWIGTAGGVEYFKGIPGVLLSNKMIQQDLNQNQGITLFPNPAIDYIWVKLNMAYSSKLKFEIYDLSGKNILKLQPVEISNMSVKLKLSDSDLLNAGVYILKVSGNAINESVRLIITPNK